MKIIISRDQVVDQLQLVAGVVEKRQTLPILSNLLLRIVDDGLEIIGTNLEVELRTRVPAQVEGSGAFTLPARKFSDICKNIQEGSKITIQVTGDRAKVTAGRSRFSLGTLNAQDFPSLEMEAPQAQLEIEEVLLREMVEKTKFAMGIQDVRYYLNGLLLDLIEGEVVAVATDGHRLGTFRQPTPCDVEIPVLIPRNAIVEVSRLLKERESTVKIDIFPNHVQFRIGEMLFLSKLIDGRFPDYNRVIPREVGERIVAHRVELRNALIRTSVLSNEKLKGINIDITEGLLRLKTHNSEQDEAEEELEVEYVGTQMTVGFNVEYMIEILGALEEESVELWIENDQSSCLIKGVGNENSRYVVMPMRV